MNYWVQFLVRVKKEHCGIPATCWAGFDARLCEFLSWFWFAVWWWAWRWMVFGTAETGGEEGRGRRPTITNDAFSRLIRFDGADEWGWWVLPLLSSFVHRSSLRRHGTWLMTALVFSRPNCLPACRSQCEWETKINQKDDKGGKQKKKCKEVNCRESGKV